MTTFEGMTITLAWRSTRNRPSRYVPGRMPLSAGRPTTTGYNPEPDCASGLMRFTQPWLCVLSTITSIRVSLFIFATSFLETISSASISLGSTMESRTFPASAISPGSTLRTETIPSMLAFNSVL